LIIVLWIASWMPSLLCSARRDSRARRVLLAALPDIEARQPIVEIYGLAAALDAGSTIDTKFESRFDEAARLRRDLLCGGL
jgi:hypothetical protein